MWKIWLAAAVAVTASFMTVFLGIINEIRYSVILYRALWAFIVGGVVVGAAGFIYEKFLLTYLLDKAASKMAIQDTAVAKADDATDMITEAPDTAGADESSFADDAAASEDGNTPEFSPFTTKNLDNVSAPKS